MDAAPATPRSLILVRQRNDSGAPSGVDLHVAARPPHTHQDIPLGFVARRESVLGIHLYITFEQFGDTSAATPLAAAARNTHAMRFRDLEQSLAGGHNAHLAGTRELDRTLQWWRAPIAAPPIVRAYPKLSRLMRSERTARD